jgi:hypothetical protein
MQKPSNGVMQSWSLGLPFNGRNAHYALQFSRHTWGNNAQRGCVDKLQNRLALGFTSICGGELT